MIPSCLAFVLITVCIYTSSACKVIVSSNGSKPITKWNHTDVTYHYGSNNDYRLIKRLGSGTFGEAYLAMNVLTRQQLVAKIYLSAGDWDSMTREVAFLQSICGGPNIVRLEDVLRDEKSGAPVMMMEFVKFVHHRDLYPKLAAEDIKFYFKKLLVALQFLHEHKVIHRDIKPHNVLIDPKARELRVIDFGISHWHEPGWEHLDDSGTWAYMPPEVLLDYPFCDEKVDIWAFGAMFAGVIFRRDYFFRGSGKEGHLNSIGKSLGTEAFMALVERYNISYDRNISIFANPRPKVEWSKYATSLSKHLVTPEAVQVLTHTLAADPQQRLSAKELQSLPYFT